MKNLPFFCHYICGLTIKYLQGGRIVIDMDLNIVIKALTDTNDKDNNVRKEAERVLNELTNAPGFFPALLSILSQDGLPHTLKQSASIALKNRLRNRYDTDSSNAISAEDKAVLRQNIIPVLCSQQDISVAHLMGLAVQEITSADFAQWPECISQIESEMQSGNLQHFYNAIYVILVIVSDCMLRCFQYRTTKEPVHQLTQHFFPAILQWIQTSFKASPSQENLQILHLVVKMYYTSLDLSEMDQSVIAINDLSTWIPLLCQLIQMPAINPENNDPTVSVQEKATFPEWHVKKWCMTTILRVNHNFLNMKDHQEYNVWIQNFAPSILTMVLEQLNVYKTSVYYYNKVAIKLFTFLKDITDIAVLYRSLKTHMPFIINEVLPKALALTKEEVELWKEDPIQFVVHVHDMYYEFSNVRVEAGNFLVYLSKVRANDILALFLNYLTESFNVYDNTNPEQRDFLAKEWMLIILECRW
ncbi:uncharacterized protein [Blastocystis hominis]|uniref:Importin N-terminal domain-containing protein n=1 Tax=Blastocystis hominis TaxID=12968 RepID=D8LXC8_BLAHO|nr:uncharacterized protein [Blastocystis hominis]CBK20923.2 unnamed protein product [Blastocystis hominis]|eukprot:XP_012894971.1 uncharacterized protein [Blastocystis hominis]